MKNLWLVLLALSMAVSGRAQTASAAQPAIGYRYCALLVRGNHFTFPEELTLDYGQRAGVPIQNAELAEAERQVKSAKSVIAILTYFDKLGWECFSITNAPASTFDGRNTSETRYLLRQRL